MKKYLLYILTPVLILVLFFVWKHYFSNQTISILDNTKLESIRMYYKSENIDPVYDFIEVFVEGNGDCAIAYRTSRNKGTKTVFFTMRDIFIKQLLHKYENAYFLQFKGIEPPQNIDEIDPNAPRATLKLAIDDKEKTLSFYKLDNKSMQEIIDFYTLIVKRYTYE